MNKIKFCLKVVFVYKVLVIRWGGRRINVSIYCERLIDGDNVGGRKWFLKRKIKGRNRIKSDLIIYLRVCFLKEKEKGIRMRSIW